MARKPEGEPHRVGVRVTVHNVDDVAAFCKEGDTGTIVGHMLEGGILVKVDNPLEDDVNGIWAFEPKNLEFMLPKGNEA